MQKLRRILTSGKADLKIIKLTADNIHLEHKERTGSGEIFERIIPIVLVSKLVAALVDKRITVDDIDRNKRKKENKSHLFDELELKFDKFILGYDASFKKICGYVVEHYDESTENNETNAPHLNAISLQKPFLLLAGISGTGKTRFVREQAKATGSIAETYCLTSVRPDWHEPSDLLGYISRLSGQAEFITTDVLKFIAKAWRAMYDAGLTIETQISEGRCEQLVVAGDRNDLDAISPYWLCLDEMNLAPVEQYFADYLSVLETRDWQWDDESFSYRCDPLLKASTIEQVADEQQIRNALGFSASKYDDLWTLIRRYGLSIPFNLIVAGTVNMDETTHGFSRKVIDRALSFDFGEFFPNNINEFFEPTKQPKTFSYPIYSQARHEQFNRLSCDNDAKKTQNFFVAINQVLKNTPFELAYRAFNELCLSVVSFKPKNSIELEAVFDDFLMCKVLPRIEGDDDKLSGDHEENLLEQLSKVITEQLADINEVQRPDLLREYIKDSSEIISVDCRSIKKLEQMNQQLIRGFISFWP